MNDAAPTLVGRKYRSQRLAWIGPVLVFGFVLTAQLALVSTAGTDIPFHDQWDVEGRSIYPSWRDGTWSLTDLFRAHNEHRIVWTRALDLMLFAANGQWDPLLQLVAGAVLRAAVAAGLVWGLAHAAGVGTRVAVALGLGLSFLPHLAWHNALWGFQSQVYFALLFSLGTLALLGAPSPSRRRQVAGLTMGGAALLAMGPAALVPAALLGLVALRVLERRRWEAARWGEAWPALVLMAAGLALRPDEPGHASLRAHGISEFLRVAARVLGWPHGNGVLSTVVLNAPLMGVLVLRVLRRREAGRGEDFMVLVGGWSALVGLAAAWMRGGAAEMAVGLPSRYVDFMILLPLANAWSAAVLAREGMARSLRVAPVVAGAWLAFLLIGWLGLSAEVMRRLVLPRARDREAPVRLLRAYQISGDAAVFAGQPLLLVPHPNLESVRAVLNDPHLRGALPPSLQPEERPGVLSQAVRRMLGHQ